VENPHRQRWSDVAKAMSKEMGLPVVSHRVWLRDVRELEHGEPSLLCFDETGFQRIGLGAIGLDTTRAREVSQHLQNAQPIDEDTLRSYAMHARW
jgi:hypothetical protein